MFELDGGVKKIHKQMSYPIDLQVDKGDFYLKNLGVRFHVCLIIFSFMYVYYN